MLGFHNYFLIVLTCLLLILIVITKKRKLIKKLWLKRLFNITATAAVIIMVFAVVLFPELSGVKTTGRYAYESRVLELTDESRLESFSDDGGFRKLSVLVYYPVMDGTASCPLVVFSHGGMSTKTSNISLYKELASHGYIVAGIDHAYHALSTVIEGKRIFIDSEYMRELNTEDSNKDIEGSYMYFQKWMKLRTDDINFVIDELTDRAGGESDLFYSLTDARRIGVAGHSLGGSAALGVARQRDGIKAAVALESPYMCDITGVDGAGFIWNDEPFPCAVMNIYSDNGYPLIESDNKYVQNKNYLFNAGNVEYYYIKGSNHYSLTDLVRKSPVLCALLGGGYSEPGYVTLEFINQKCVEFFNKYLK